VAAPGERDPAFGERGIVRLAPDPDADNAEDRIEIDARGRYIVLATSSSETSQLLRFTRHGALDLTFSGDGSVAVPGGPWHDLALQADGGIVLAGTAGGDLAAARFDQAGGPDTAFGSAGLATTHVDSVGSVNSGEAVRQELNRIEVQRDGRVVAMGNVRGCLEGPEPRCHPRGSLVVRYTPGGELDAGFGDGGVTELDVSRDPSGRSPYALGRLYSMALQPDGAILVGGTTGRDMVLVRLTPGGALDPSFSDDGLVISPHDTRRVVEEAISPGAAIAIVQQDSGRIVAIGEYELVALRPDGTLDTHFGSNRRAEIDNTKTTNLGVSAADAAVDAKGRILLAGGAEGLTAVMRFFSNGRHDPRFAGDGLAHLNLSRARLRPRAAEESATGIALDAAGSPVAVGFAFSGQKGDLALVRFRGGDGRLARCRGRAATLQGTPQAERLSASGAIVAFGGDDRIRSSGGPVCAGAGDDRVLAPRFGAVYGQHGDDAIIASGRGRAYGGPGDDTIRSHRGFEGSDSYFGGPGNDLLAGGRGPDRLFGGIGDDRLIGEGGRDALFGGSGADLLIGGAGTDRIVGGAGSNRVFPGADSPSEAIYQTRRPGFAIRLTVRRRRIAGVHISARLRCSDGTRSGAEFNTNKFKARIDRRGRFRYRSRETYEYFHETLLAGRVTRRFITGLFSLRDEYEHVLCTTGSRKRPKLRFTARRVRR
jgi:uncharacterized delta-60 repeat protein